MMKKVLKAFALAATLAVPAISGAQTPFDPSVSVQINSQPLPTPGTGFSSFGNGGGFLATFTLDFVAPPSSKTFTDYLIWCIDVTRTVEVPGTYTYQGWTASSFAASNLGSAKPNDLTDAQMRGIVSLVSTLQTNWDAFTAQQRADYQGSIWSTFRGETGVYQGDVNAGLDGWIVLYNGQNQTFLTYVPEPADSALLLVGMAGVALMVFKRRRAV